MPPICGRSLRRQAHREDQRQAVFGVGRAAAAQGTELLLPVAERPRHQARRTSHPPMEDEAVADTKKNCAKQGRTIVFIDESGVSERPHRVRTWIFRGKTPILQYSFTWNQLPPWRASPSGILLQARQRRRPRPRTRRLSQKSPPPSPRPQTPHRLGSPGRPIAAAWSAITSTPKAAISSWSSSPYAPELNPVEYLWAHWKQHEMPNFCPKDFELSAFARALKLQPTQRRKLLVAAFWKQAHLPF